MKRGTRNFLGRKNQSLFDTNVKIKDMDNVELVLDSPAIPESGTASVRARPTVKHHAASDSFQGFAVPTPKVPLLPPVSAPKVNGSGGGFWSNGSVKSVPDLVEGEIFIPPPPTMAPPPPPEGMIPPPPFFMGDLNSVAGLGTLQPAFIPASKPSAQAPSMEVDQASLKPAAMAQQKPPPNGSINTASYTHTSFPPAAEVPEHPSFAAPQAPIERQKKTHKTPPPKPMRMSSIPTLDSPPHTPAPPPPVQTSAVSSFNPQNKAKLYDAPKATFLTGYEDRDAKPKQMLLLEDSGSANTTAVLVQADGKVPKVVAPSNPVSKDVQELKENVENTQPTQTPLAKPNQEAATVTLSTQQETTKPLQTPPQILTPNQEANSMQLNLEPSKDKIQESPSQSHNFSPLLDRKLRNLKGSEGSGAREGHAASPLALLMAAKQREKQKQTHALSQENAQKKNEPQQSASIQPSDSSPNSFVVMPNSSSASSPTSQDRIRESSKLASPVEQMQPIQTSNISSSFPQIRSQVPSTTPALSQTTAAGSPVLTNPLEQNKEQSSSKSQLAPAKDNSEGFSLPFLPPPPEFDDFNDIMEPPSSNCPPDSPVKKAAPAVNLAPPAPPLKLSPPAPSPSPPVNLAPPAPPLKLSPPAPSPSPPVNLAPPAPPLKLSPPAPPLSLSSSVNSPPPIPPPLPPSPKPKPMASPKLPASDSDVKLKHQVQTNTPPQLPSTLSPSQATLLSILQKKMLEMDHKMSPVKEPESSGDDWNGPLSDEETKVPIVPKARPQTKNFSVANKAATLDMRELKSKVVKPNLQMSSVKAPTSNGPSKHHYGMTFTIRPGTKQPITPVTKGESY